MNKNIDTQQVLGFALGLAFWWFLLGSVQVAVGVIALVFVHEMGHFIEARRRGIAVSMPIFTPFGAYVQTGSSRSIVDEAAIKLAGPLVSGLASLVVLTLGYAMGSSLMIQVGTYGAFLNLFNLIPLDPFDGGGIAQVFGRWTVVPGVAAFVYFFFMLGGGSTLNLMFGMYFAYQAYQAYQHRTQQWHLMPGYFRSSTGATTAIALAYLAVGGVLAWSLFNPGFVLTLLNSVGF